MTIAITFRGNATTIKELARDHGLNEGTLRWRWKKAGRPDKIPAELLTPPMPAQQQMSLRRQSPRKKDAYDDPTYLPHIKRGDLAHPSATKNTGAARNTCEA
ncbi:MAG: hypothetical protein LBD10_14610 [Desulfobulbus sp.]|jgi:hypothetical protein|uniref:hypothetical protein n=1 Tax=Desulfobulbus sp. TaxID=895 RepID=UPI00284AA0B5|nr:hypothetical protein [Desulfobulbus sp.]MDR2551419.1 hypothetical protein [Desulfobulbus sp.]